MDKAGLSDDFKPLSGTGPVAEVTLPSSRLFPCACVRRWIPLAYREELYQVLRLTGPLLASRILHFFLPFVNTIFCGHLGNAELAGLALASATINVITVATAYGMSLACDTLVSQTFGGKNMLRVGDILQKSMLILLLFCLPCWGILINTQSILLAVQQEAEVARIAQQYVLAFLPAVPALSLHQLQVSYLQNQGIILPQMYTAAVVNVINLVLNYVLLFKMELGVNGAAAANSISQIVLCLSLFAYIRWKKLHTKTWGGWSTASLQDWGSFMQLAIPSTFMLCFEWWIYEIGSFLAGMLGKEDLAAQHVLLELGAITYMFPLGVHAAACVRVGNALGAGDTSKALVTSKVALFLSASLAVLQGIVLAASKSVMGRIFTSDEEIVGIVSHNLTVYVFGQFFESLVCVCSGIMLGAGRQKIAAISNLICYYCVGLPLMISLMFLTELRILGLWLAFLICGVIQTCLFMTYIFRLDWQKVTEEAQKRASKTRRLTCVGQRGSLGQPVLDSLVQEGLDNQPTESGSTPYGASDVSKPGGYTSVISQEPEKPDAEAAGNAGKDGPEEGGPTAMLSVPQLVLRRGLALLTALLVLGVGVAINLLLPLPEPYPSAWANSTSPTSIPNITIS